MRALRQASREPSRLVVLVTRAAQLASGEVWAWVWWTVLLLTLIGLTVFALGWLTETLSPSSTIYPGDN